MGCWSPLNAMKAYVHTLQLCKDYCNRDCNSNNLLEPECIEFVSALAAGNQARLMLDIASDGLSPSTLALAIAARHTGGWLVCVCHDRDQESLKQTQSQIQNFDLGDAVHFVVGDPCDVIKQYKNIDFADVDHRIRDHEELLLEMDMNPNGSVVMLSNLFCGRRRPTRASYVRGTRKNTERRGNIESAILPIGNGMEVTKIGKGCRRASNKRSKRIFLVYEE